MSTLQMRIMCSGLHGSQVSQHLSSGWLSEESMFLSMIPECLPLRMKELSSGILQGRVSQRECGASHGEHQEPEVHLTWRQVGVCACQSVCFLRLRKEVLFYCTHFFPILYQLLVMKVQTVNCISEMHFDHYQCVYIVRKSDFFLAISPLDLSICTLSLPLTPSYIMRFTLIAELRQLICLQGICYIFSGNKVRKGDDTYCSDFSIPWAMDHGRIFLFK